MMNFDLMRLEMGLKRNCPYCGKELSEAAQYKLAVKRICKCKNCGEKIDERHIIH